MKTRADFTADAGDEEMTKGKAIVVDIQVGGYLQAKSLEQACARLINNEGSRTKINFAIKLPNGEVKTITIRDEDDETVAYGDFDGLPSMLDYAQALHEEGKI